MIKWIKEVSKEDRESDPTSYGYYHSLEKRFDISPTYRHTIYPDGFKIVDHMGKRGIIDGQSVLVSVTCTFDRVRDCKFWAERQVKE